MKRYILFFSVIAVVFFVFNNSVAVQAASFSLEASKETFVVGDTFSVDVLVNSEDVGVNAAQATIKFPKDIIQVISVDKTNSVFNFWLQEPNFNNETGLVTFIGGNFSGISGKSLHTLHINFEVKGAGTVGIIFSDGAITASDGSGTNVLSLMTGLQLTSITKQDATLIKPPQIVRPVVPTGKLPIKPAITVPLYSDPEGWYSDTSKFIAQWTLPKDVIGVATVLDKNASFEPKTSEGLIDNKTFDPLEVGIWYLHVRFKNNIGWGPTTHYRIGIDTIPPISFVINLADGVLNQDVAPTIEFATNDQPSGISSYKIFIDGIEKATTDKTVYTIPAQVPGKHTIAVRAYDLAGNATEARTTIRIQEPPFITIAGIHITKFWFFSGLIGMLLAGIAVGWYLSILERRQRRRRIIIAQRDVQASCDLIQKDITDLLKKYEGGNIVDQRGLEEIKFILRRIAEKSKEIKPYVLQNIEEIDK